MATVALYALAASATAGSTTFAASLLVASAVTAGAYIDQTYTYPALFGSDGQSFEGPKLDDRAILTSSYGSPIIRIAGPQNRVGGNVIFQHPEDELRVRVVETEVGGKGTGGGQKSTEFFYSIDIAVGIGEGFNKKPLYAIKKVWADSIIIWTNGSGTDGQTTETLGGVSKITSTGPNEYFDDMRFYYGHADQSPDTYIQAVDGIDNTPAYTGLGYVMIENLQLSSFGNRIPSITVEVVADASRTVASVIDDLMEESGASSEEFDTSLVGGCFRGGLQSGPTQPAKMLEAVLKSYAISVVHKQGKWFFMSNEYLPETTVAESTFGASTGRDSADQGLKVSYQRDADIPTQVTANFTDPALDMQRNSVVVKRAGNDHNTNVVVDYPMSLSEQEAKTRCIRELKSLSNEKMRFAGTLPPSMCWVSPNYVLNANVNGVDRQIRLTNVSLGANFMVEFSGVLHTPPGVLRSTVEDAGGGETSSPVLLYPPNLQLVPLDLPPLDAAGLSTPGIYLAASNLGELSERTGTKTGGYFTRRGATVYRKLSDDSWTEVADVRTQGVLGVADDTLSAPSAFDAIDAVNTVEVTLVSGTIASCTEAELLAGYNRAVIGRYNRWEVIGYKTVTDLGSNQYRLSNLLRGLADTSQMASLHAVGDIFVVIAPSTTTFLPLSSGLSGEQLTLQAVAYGDELDPDGGTTIRPIFKNMTPFAPVNITGTEDNPTAGDLLIEWEHHSRSILPVFETDGPVSPIDQPETYRVQILNAAKDAIVRTFDDVIGAREVVYTAADRTTDGLGADVNVQIYQVNSTVGVGNVGTADDL